MRMMRAHKKLLRTGIMLLVAGLIISGISFAALGFDIRALSTANFVTNEHEINDSFENISIKGDTADIAFVQSEDGKCRVVCFEDEKEPHRVSAESGTLTIEHKKKIKLYISIVPDRPKVTVYLPEKAYKALSVDTDTGDVSIPDAFTFENVGIKTDTGDIDMSASAGDVTLKTDTGSIRLHDMTADTLSLSTDTGCTGVNNAACKGTLNAKVNTGKTDFSEVTCANLYSKGNTGRLNLTNVTAAGEFHIERDTGDVHFEGCDAEAIFVKTDTGNVTGSFRTDKVFLTKTDTGRVDVPKTITGGRCEITTDTGNIKISVP